MSELFNQNDESQPKTTQWDILTDTSDDTTPPTPEDDDPGHPEDHAKPIGNGGANGEYTAGDINTGHVED